MRAQSHRCLVSRLARFTALVGALAGVVSIVLSGAPALAQGHDHSASANLVPDECKLPVEGQLLEQPKVIQADEYGILRTVFVVDSVQFACVPQWDAANNRWTTESLHLRNYGTPKTRDDLNDLEWALPGPTLRVKKTYLQDPTRPPGPENPVVEMGSRVNLTLHNKLPNTTYPYDRCLPHEVVEPNETNTCDDPPCTYEETPPECFHGSEVTNLHYHGTHVSPQPHQDFVLLNLYSSEQTDPPPPPEDDYNQVGSYHYSIDPFPWNQAPGTHWYHPHKHGSTALQVANGMSGTLIIQGPFDDWLYELYGVDDSSLDEIEDFEKIIIVQQLQEDINFYKPNSAVVPQPTVNGQASPVIEMHPGEVQRWRFVGATVHAAGALNVGFPETMEVRQIAQDGVQFASENYVRQPFVKKAQRAITAAGNQAGGTVLQDVSFGNYVISPGNRADFLVRAPLEPGEYDLSFELVHRNLADAVSLPFHKRNATDESDRKISGIQAAAAATKPELFTVRVVSAELDKPLPIGDLPVPRSDPKCSTTPAPKDCWPEMPYYLRDLPRPTADPRKVRFSMTEPDGTVTKNAEQRNSFWINDMQYMADCAAETMAIGTVEDWTVTNDSPLGHPFHIHINPFQVLDYPNFPDIEKAGPPYPWMDTIPLPVGKCDDRGQCTEVGANIRHAFEDFTGGYVIHCHFLGHEDRGMMLNVQTVCPESGDPGLWGRPQAAGADNCAITQPALPVCKSDY